MNGMTGAEFLHATVTADFIHWSVVGVIALVGWLITSWIKRRQLSRHQIRPVDGGAALERCVCASCGNPHPRMLSREQMRAFVDEASSIVASPSSQTFPRCAKCHGEWAPSHVCANQGAA